MKEADQRQSGHGQRQGKEVRSGEGDRENAQE